MNLRDYLKTVPLDGRDDFASRCKTTWGYLKQVAYGNKEQVGAEIAGRVEIESGGAVTIEEMPCDFPAEEFVAARTARQPRGVGK